MSNIRLGVELTELFVKNVKITTNHEYQIVNHNGVEFDVPVKKVYSGRLMFQYSDDEMSSRHNMLSNFWRGMFRSPIDTYDIGVYKDVVPVKCFFERNVLTLYKELFMVFNIGGVDGGVFSEPKILKDHFDEELFEL